MRIFKQPTGYELEQPLLNKILRVHVSLNYRSEAISGKNEAWKEYYDSETRAPLYHDNWRVKLIIKLGT